MKLLAGAPASPPSSSCAETPSCADTAASVDPARGLAPGTLVAGRYRITTQVGRGGMGVVYKARDLELDQDVALKVLRPDMGTDPGWVARFRRELVLAREITHKNVVRIHDIGESEGLRFLSMRLVEGRSLLGLLQSEGRLPVGRALHIFRQVAEALQQAHDAGIVHRDLKPANVLLSPDDTAYITDFGVACSLGGDRMTRAGEIVGTLEYLSPEQIAGEGVDGRSDVYALGLLLFEMLTGDLPLRSASRKVTAVPRRGRSTGSASVRPPAYVRAVIRRCLEPVPARRYSDVRALLADLDSRRAGLRDRLSHPVAILLVAALALPVTGFAYRYWSRGAGLPAASPAAAGPTSVAVLPLGDETAEPSLAWTATGVPEMLSAQLAESAPLRVVSPGRVLRTLNDLGLSGAPLEETSLRRIAQMLDVTHLVSGRLRRAGSTLRLDLQLLAVDGAGTLAARSLAAETRDPGDLFRVIGEVGAQLHRDLGAPAAAAVLTPEPGTASLEAANSYREGRELLLAGNSVQAAPVFEKAVAADPGYASAWVGLGEAYQALGYQDKAVSAVEKAVEVLGPPKTRLAWRARARLALLRGDAKEAESVYGELAQRYPNDTEALFDLATAQSGRGASAKAVETLGRLTALDKTDARAFYLLGRNMIQAGDARQALSGPLLQALTLMTQIGNQQGRADVLNATGVAHQRLGEYASAIEKYGEAAEVRKQIGDRRGTAVSLKNRGSVRILRGDFAQAEPDLRAAQQIYAAMGDKKGLAEVGTDMGALHEGRGLYAEARRAYQEALRIRRELGNEQQLAQSYDNVGYVFFLEGEHESALAYWRQALDLREKNGDKRGIVHSLQNMGFLQTAQGRWPEAMKSFLDALERARDIESARAIAVSQGNLGLLHQYEGRYAGALGAYADALKVLTKLDDKRGLAEFTIKEAGALVELGRLEEGGAKLDLAFAWVSEVRNHEQAADYHAARGEWHLARGEPGPARRAFGEAVAEAGLSGSPAAVLRARISRGAALVALGDLSAHSDLAAAMRKADALGDALLRLRASEALAAAELARGRLAAAEDAVRRAIDLGQRCGWESGLWRLHALRGRIRQARGDAAGAEAAFAESARRVASLSDALPQDWRAPFQHVAGREKTGPRVARAALPAR